MYDDDDYIKNYMRKRFQGSLVPVLVILIIALVVMLLEWLNLFQL